MMRYTRRSTLQRVLIRTLFLLLILTMAGCDFPRNKAYQFTRFAMDTVINYTIIAENESAARDRMLLAQREIERVEHLLWEENPQSEIYRFNQSESGIETSEEVYEFVSRAQEYFRREAQLDLTRNYGVFDLTLKPVLDLYDFKADNPKPPAPSEVRDRLKYVGMETIRLEGDAPSGEFIISKEQENTAIAVGGLAKGYAVDRAIQVLKSNGVQNALINAGGDLYCLGTRLSHNWRIGIQHPGKRDAIVEVLEISERAVATSGNYQRYFMYQGKRYHHILNPETGSPAEKSQSATVIAPTTEQADAWSTILFIRGNPEGLELLDKVEEVTGMVIDSAGVPHYSEGFRSYIDTERSSIRRVRFSLSML